MRTDNGATTRAKFYLSFTWLLCPFGVMGRMLLSPLQTEQQCPPPRNYITKDRKLGQFWKCCVSLLIRCMRASSCPFVCPLLGRPPISRSHCDNPRLSLAVVAFRRSVERSVVTGLVQSAATEEVEARGMWW